MSLQAANLYATVSVAGAEKSVRDLSAVGSQVTKTQGVMAGLSKNGGQIASGIGQVSRGLFRVAEKGAVALAAMGVGATVVAVNFEDAFKGIQKTVEGTPESLDKLNASLKELSTRIPVSYVDLAGIAQEAGALGVAADDVDKFSEAVARTVAATVGLSNDTASEAFGKIGTILGLKGKDYERLGSTLVELGNTAASTEEDIVGVTLRFAAAGHQAGLSRDAILGWSSALASLGPQAEAAGSALARIFNNMTRNIAIMNDKNVLGKNAKVRVDAFAAVTGLSVKDFVALYKKDSSAALQLFLGNLAKMDKFSAGKALSDAGIINVRDKNAILALSQQTDDLTKSLDIAHTAWTKNTALMDVSNKRFSGVKSTLKELWNTVLVGADAFGNGLLPAIDRVAKRAQSFTLGHLGEIRQLGKDIGKSIDEIDWSRVESGARRVADVAATILEIVKKIPPEVGIAVVSFLGINKLSGGLIGRGTEDIVKGVLGAGGTLLGAGLRGLGGKIGGLAGGALGMVGAQPVYVVNMPASGFGGAPGVAPEVAAAGGGILDAGIGAAIIGFGAPLAAAFALAVPLAIAAALATSPSRPYDPSDYGRTKRFTPDQNKATEGYRSGGPTNSVPGGGVQMADRLDKSLGLAGQGLDRFGNSLGKAADDVIDLPRLWHTLILSFKRDSDRARGTSLTGAAAKAAGFETRTHFLRDTAKGESAVVTAGYFASRFVEGTYPWYQSAKNAERELKAMKHAQARAIASGDVKTAHKIGEDIKTMKRVLGGDLGHIDGKLNKIEQHERDILLATRQQIEVTKDLDQTPTITITPSPLMIDGKEMVHSLVRYGVQISGPLRVG